MKLEPWGVLSPVTSKCAVGPEEELKKDEKKMFLLYTSLVLIYSWCGWPLSMLPFDRAPSAS